MLRRFLILLVMLVMVWAAGARETDADTVKPYQEALARDPDDKDALRAVGVYYLQHGEFGEAEKCGQHLLRMGEGGYEPDFCLLWGHFIVGAATIDTGDGMECYAHLEQARTIAERVQDHKALMSIYNSFGNYAMFANSDVYSSLSYYFQALEMARKMGDRRSYAIMLSNIAGAYSVRGDPSGLEYAEEAIRLARECGEDTPLFYGTMNAVQYYLKTDSLPGCAEATIAELERMAREQGFGAEADIYLYRALLCEKKKDLSGAYSNYARAMEHFRDASESTVTAVYLHYSRLLRADRHLSSAIQVLEYGLRGSAGDSASLHKSQLMKELALCYRDSGKYAEALELSLRYNDYIEQRFDEARERATQETRIKHDFYSREQQIDRQRMEILDNHFKMALLGGGIVVLFVALGMAYYQYRKKDRLYGIIVARNRESMQREQALQKQVEALRAGEGVSQAAAGLSSDKQQDLMTRFTALMDERRLFTDPSLTVAAVADELGTNRTYLSRAINESTGKTFTQVVNSYRVRQAVAEISDLEADKPLKQIALESGFSSLSTFYTAFQSAVGMTPARYRAKLKEM